MGALKQLTLRRLHELQEMQDLIGLTEKPCGPCLRLE